MINGVQIPNADNRGRAFPLKESNDHYVGPALVDGKLYQVDVWFNLSESGRPYVRMMFKQPEEKQNDF